MVKRIFIYSFLWLFLFGVLAEDSTIVDLTSWSFDEDGPVELRGEWDFFPEEFIEPLSDLPAPVTLSVPGSWNKVQNRLGYGTYRLKILLTDVDTPLALSFGRICTSYKFYVDGELVRKVGEPVRKKEDSQPDGNWYFQWIPIQKGEVELMFHISNFQELDAGLTSSLFLGKIEDISARNSRKNIINGLLFGIYFSLGFYHLILYLFRRREDTALYFGLFTLMLALRVLMVDSSRMIILSDLLHSIPWVWLRKIEYFTFYILAITLPPYFHNLFKGQINPKFGRTLGYIGAGYIALTLLTPMRIYTLFLLAYEIIVVLWCLYAVITLIKLTKKKVWEGKVVLIGMSVFLTTIIFDVMVSQGLSFQFALSPIGFFIFLMAQSSILIKRFAESYVSIEKLTEELNFLLDERKKYQKLLERRVMERTADLAQAVEDAKAANQAKGDFLARMSHEIRTPMNGILGFAEIVKESDQLDEVKLYTNNIIAESEKLLILINQLLDLSRIDAGALQLDNAPFVLSDILESIESIFKPQAEEKEIRFILTCDKENLSKPLYGDSFRLRQILINIVGNAIKFTEQGHVELIIEKNFENSQKRGFIFIVHDTGKGIAKEKLDRIFDSFVQEDTSITRQYGGSGLGTAISRSFVELMNGEIGVESIQGMGTSFWFSLLFPVYSEELDQRFQAQNESRRTKFPGKRILLAEDYPANQEVVKNYLKKSEVDLVLAADGLQACEILSKQFFDLILLDIHMPHRNGYSVAEYIRQELKSDMIIIGLTADGYQQVQDKCMELGMNDFLTKPIRREKLLDTLAKWL